MDAQCHHHPGREAVGTCCYCERPLCEECLTTNRQGKSYCRREDDCLAYQDGQSSPGEPTSPVVAYLIDEFSLDAQVRRISEILEELEELKGLLEDIGGGREPDAFDPRIPGFCSTKLAEEAVALLGLLSLRVGFIRKEYEPSGRSESLDRANEIKAFLEQEAEPKIHEYLDWARPYAQLEVSEVLASIGTQDQQDGC